MCKILLYDILTRPLELINPLRPYINIQSITGCVDEIITCILKILYVVHNTPSVLAVKIGGEVIDDTAMKLIADLSTYGNYKEAERMMNTLCEASDTIKYEFKYAIEVCMIHGVAKKTRYKYLANQQFMTYIVYELLGVMPIVHSDHTYKVGQLQMKSPANVPQWKIDQLKRNMVTNSLAIKIPTNRDYHIDLYD